MKQRMQGLAIGLVIALVFAVTALNGGEDKEEVDDVIQPVPLREEHDAMFLENYKELMKSKEEVDEDCDC